jgi:hypothetical protein
MLYPIFLFPPVSVLSGSTAAGGLYGTKIIKIIRIVKFGPVLSMIFAKLVLRFCCNHFSG